MTAVAEFECHDPAEPASPVRALSRAVVAHAAWEERPHLLRVARNRGLSEADAQDVVSEAVARALEGSDSLDPQRVGAWLTAVTVNLCADLGRDRRRLHKRIRFAVQHGTPPPSLESVVVERVSAATVVPLLARLPTEQWRALTLRADGHAVAEIANRLRVSEKAAESLLSRARTAARAIVSAASAVVAPVVWIARRTRPTAVAASSAAFIIAVGVPYLAPASGHSHVKTVRTVPALESTASAHGRLSRPASSHPVPSSPHRVLARNDWSASAHRSGHAVRPPVAVKAGSVSVRNDGADMQRPDETFFQSVQHCVADGLELSASYVGC